MLKDIQTKSDVALLVNTFYDKVLLDKLLAPFFQRINFEAHLPKMIHFWSFALLDEPGYTTNVTDKHLKMPLEKIHFDQWLSLFNETVDVLFNGEKATMAKQRAAVIGWTINSKLSS
jgi:hemoglobin